MDFNAILNILIFLLLAYVAFLKEYFLTYAKKKAENIASLEDTGKLTQLTKSAEMPFMQKQEELKYSLVIAQEGEKFRIEKYKELYGQLNKLKTALSSIEVHSKIVDEEKEKKNYKILWESLPETIIFLKVNIIELDSYRREIKEFEEAVNKLLGSKDMKDEERAHIGNNLADKIDNLKSSVFFRVGRDQIIA